MLDKSKIVVQVDSREKGNLHITNKFDDMGIKYLTSKLFVGDYTLLHKQNVCIDKKKDIMEIAQCLFQGHERFRDECDRAFENNIKLYILIEDDFIYNVQGVQYYKIPRYKSNSYSVINGARILTHHKGDKMGNFNPETLMKVMITFQEKHHCKFVFCKKIDSAEKILSLLGVKIDG